MKGQKDSTLDSSGRESSLDPGELPPARPRTYQMGMAQRLVLLTLRVVAVEVFDTGAKAETATFGLMRSRRLKLRIAGVLGDDVGRRRRREAPRAPRANIYTSGPLFYLTDAAARRREVSFIVEVTLSRSVKVCLGFLR